MGPSLLLTWRRELRTRMEAQGLARPVASASAPLFVPAVIANHRLATGRPFSNARGVSGDRLLAR